MRYEPWLPQANHGDVYKTAAYVFNLRYSQSAPEKWPTPTTLRTWATDGHQGVVGKKLHNARTPDAIICLNDTPLI